MARSPTLLIVDEDASMRRTMEAILAKAGMQTLLAASGEEALKKLLGASAHLMLLDVQMPGLAGVDVLRIVHDKHPDVGVIMCSVLKDLPVVVEAMQSGALDYITKDFSPGELTARVRKTLDQLNVRRELVQPREEVRAQGDKPMLGGSVKMRAVAMLADKIAAKPITVLITGESGTGKEVLARYLHIHSDRAAGRFVAVNLSAK